MTRAYALIFFGLLVALSPFIGLPLSWLMWGLPVIGFVVAFIGFSLRKPSSQEESHVELIAPETSSVS